MKVKVENETYIKDLKSGLVQENDKSKLEKHRSLRRALRNKAQKIDELVEKIDKLEQQMEKLNATINT